MMRIKWANPQKQIQGRVYKRSRNTSSSTTTKKIYKKTYPKSQYNKQVVKSLPELEDELEHSLDSLTAVTVMFDSLRHAYTTCKSEIDQSSTPTRLGDMERELLTAYDDLGIQVRQLGRHIGKLEKQIKEFHDKNNNNGCCNTSIISSSSSSPSSSSSSFSPLSSTTTSPGTPTLILDDDNSNKNYSPPLALLPLEATPPPVYYIPSPPAPVVPAANVWTCDPAFSFPIQQHDEPYRVAALMNTTTTNIPCACADCCSYNNSHTNHITEYNDISWSFPPPDASAPLL